MGTMAYLMAYLMALGVVGGMMPPTYEIGASIAAAVWDWWVDFDDQAQAILVAGALAFVGVPWTMRENARNQREAIAAQFELARESERLRKLSEIRPLAIELFPIVDVLTTRADAIARLFRHGHGNVAPEAFTKAGAILAEHEVQTKLHALMSQTIPLPFAIHQAARQIDGHFWTVRVLIETIQEPGEEFGADIGPSTLQALGGGAGQRMTQAVDDLVGLKAALTALAESI